MLKFVGDASACEIILSQLHHRKQTVQMQGYDIFKIFVANPKKSDTILAVLKREQDFLVKFLDDLFDKNERRTEFNSNECEMIIDTIEGL